MKFESFILDWWMLRKEYYLLFGEYYYIGGLEWEGGFIILKWGWVCLLMVICLI